VIVPGIVSAAAVVVGFGAAVLLVIPAARRNLGVLHPAIAWLALEAVFFGVGSVALALVDGVPGVGVYVAASVVTFGAAVWLADRWSRRREGFAENARTPTVLATETGWRRGALVAMAVVAVATVAPTLAAVGLPLLSGDVTAARSEITGLPAQLLRVTLPGLVATWLLASAAGDPPFGARWLAAVTLGGAIALGVVLANRYLPLELIAVVILAWLLAGHRFPLRTALAVAGLGAVVFVGLGVWRAADRATSNPIEFAAARTASRLFLVQPRTLAALQDRIPAEEPFFGGLTWLRRAGPLFGRPDIPNLGYWIYPSVVADADTPGYAAPGLIGEAWANFGAIGVVLFGALGVLCERLGRVVAVRRERIVDVVAGAMAILFLARTHALGLLGFGLLLALALGWRLVAGRGAGLFATLRKAASWRLASVPPAVVDAR
jgi:hypothetical protein